MPGAVAHSHDAHGLVIGELKQHAQGPSAHQLVHDFVVQQPHVAAAVVSLFEDENNPGRVGWTIAAQVDLDIAASDPAAHPTLEAIQNYMRNLPAPNDFVPPTVKHY
jgi:hypothetical protein